MTIGVLYLDLLIPGANSLKDKRRVIKSVKEKLRHRFNCSVAETEFMDLWRRSRLVVCVVSNESAHANSQLSEIAKFVAMNAAAELADYRIELL